jgi:hypothetical protein
LHYSHARSKVLICELGTRNPLYHSFEPLFEKVIASRLEISW